MALSFEQARACVIEKIGSHRPSFEEVDTLSAAGRILAEDVPADRDYPPFPRSARDGFAVRSADVPGELQVIGEARAGGAFEGALGSRQAVEIMTGAPLPEGAEAVVMVEHVERDGDRVRIGRGAKPGDNFAAAGSEAAQGTVVLHAGQRLGYAEIAALTMVGRTRARVFRKPIIAIVPTGDEVVDIGEQPGPFQIRNSNAWSLAVQVARAGAQPKILPIARDVYDSTRAAVDEGLKADILLLSGGVSAGKYDIVEEVLADAGARFFFDRVLIQPGQPLVFGNARETFFFGLPGNPLSTMVTFEVFARAAVELLGGARETPLPFLRARLERDVHHKPGLTRFLPARLSADGSSVVQERAQGSGDICALARSNAFIVTSPDREEWKAGEDIQVLMK